MKHVSTAVLIGVAGLAFIMGQSIRPTAAVAVPSLQPEGDAAMDPAMMEMMGAMMEAGAPGEHHRHLDLMLGTWEGTMKWAPMPGVPMMEFPGVATREWVLDGRYLRETVTSEGSDGMPFAGIGYTAYNNLDQRYETIWMDNMSSAIHPGHGHFNPATKVFTFHSQMRDPASGRVLTCWGEMDMSDPNRHTMKGWCYAADGSVFQNAEGVFVKRR